MLKTTGFSDTLSALVYGRPLAEPAQLSLQMDGDSPADTAHKAEKGRFALSLVGHLTLPVVFYVASVLTLDFSRLSHYIVTVWPTDALMLVALLRYERSPRNYASILVGGACAIALGAMTSGVTPISGIILGVSDLFEVCVVLALLAVLRIDASNLTQFKSLLVFIMIAGTLAPIGSDAVAAMAVGSAYVIPWRLVWMHLYPAHALGLIIVTPFLISITSPHWYSTQLKHRRAEAAAILVLVVTVCTCVLYFRPIIFMVVPAILFATLRFGLVGATVATLLTSVIASAFVVTGVGDAILLQTQLSERILALQIILAFNSLWSLPTAALLSERDRLLSDLSSANSQLKVDSERKTNLVIGLRRHLSIAEEKERLRLSYELHDQAGQGLIAAILEMNAIDALIAGPAHERLNVVRKRMEELGKTLHRIAWELRPPAIDELGLKKALASYVADWSEQCGTDVDFHCDDPNIDDVPSEIGTTVYRVVQEGLTNIVKHAQQPSAVSVVIGHVGTTLQVIIEDNGCGFDIGAITAKSGGYQGLGLDGMRERLLLIGGTLEIESTPGTGTALFARIVLDAQRSAA
jgi:signal transduction histidine kinase